MTEKKHILICGDRGAGKSTLIERLLAECPLPRYGFITKRMEPDETGFHPIYIHPAGSGDRKYTEENCIGICDGKTHEPAAEVFDHLGTEYIRSARPDGIIVMDELGFLESKAEVFTKAVLTALDGDIPVIAAVKSRTDVPFLNEVRSHPAAEVYYITKENREEVYQTIFPLMQKWIRNASGSHQDIC